MDVGLCRGRGGTRGGGEISPACRALGHLLACVLVCLRASCSVRLHDATVYFSFTGSLSVGWAEVWGVRRNARKRKRGRESERQRERERAALALLAVLTRQSSR